MATFLHLHKLNTLQWKFANYTLYNLFTKPDNN